MTEPSKPLKKTPLHALHVKLGARMVEFGGYDMPIQYPEGIMAEHNWTRQHAGLFDVSHMGPSFLSLTQLGGGEEAHRKVAAIVEKLVPSDIARLAPGKVQLTVLLNEDGGIVDDLMVGRPPHDDQQGGLYIVVNAGTKDNDFALIQKTAGSDAELYRADDRALIALQGPEAEAVIAGILPDAVPLTFMQFRQIKDTPFGNVIATRCGYTGEDGFEILVPAEHAEAFAKKLLSDARVKPIGLGARDSLRLEGGMCLYGHDIDATKTPVSASLAWMISKGRRDRGDFPGAQRIMSELKNGVPSKRVGIKPLGRAPAREGTEVHSVDGQVIGVVTSGGFGPTVNGPVAQGYVDTSYAKVGTPVKLIVRGKELDAEIASMPFVPAKYKR
ncbi:MAG: glycine cleavage system aminomethyltransferase GcvT [Hyphomonadaceae bacterium]|nr:glycine cleavage system aminomethyltransferase GcvT [Hyphomonadaceae bacterium]